MKPRGSESVTESGLTTAPREVHGASSLAAVNYEVPMLHVDVGQYHPGACVRRDAVWARQHGSKSCNLAFRSAAAVIERYLRHESVLERSHMHSFQPRIKSSRHLLPIGRLETSVQVGCALRLITLNRKLGHII